MNRFSCNWLLKSSLAVAVLATVATPSAAQKAAKWKQAAKDSIYTVTNAGGATLGYSAASGVQLLTVDGFAFKDLNKNGKLDKYEDWRLPVDVRAKDLASKMSVEQIAGLMLYSAHQAIPAAPRGFGAATYNGK